MPAGRQLNIRLKASDRDQLEALAFLRRIPSATLARDIVLDYLDRYRDEAGVQAALSALAEHDAAQSRQSGLSRLDSRRRLDSADPS